jgi:MYXO-CTERM domain-containing protein
MTDDLAVMGFAFDAGAYREPEVGGMAGPRAGVDSVTVRRFSIYNRGDTATAGPVVYTFRIGNVVAGQGQCPALGVHGVCTVLQNQNVPVPLRAPGGDQPLTVEIDGWPGEPHPSSNRVQLGTVSAIVAAVLPPEQDAEVVDAEVVDAEVEDARIVDARIVDARIVDARIVDAEVVDARVVDARVVDARVVDARVVDAQPVDVGALDARIVDAEGLDARVLDARVLDAMPDLDGLELDAAVITPDAQRADDARADDARVIVPIFPDFEVFDARVRADGGHGAVVVFDDARLFDAARPLGDGIPAIPVDGAPTLPDGPTADARAQLDGEVTADLGADAPTAPPPEVDADADVPTADARRPAPVADATPDADAGRTKAAGGAAGGCSCEVRSRPVEAFWGLTALGVLGLRRRRGRRPVSPTSAGSAGSA